MDGFLEAYTYLGVIVFLILTGCGLPLPEEVAIIFAGVQTSRGRAQSAIGVCLLHDWGVAR